MEENWVLALTSTQQQFQAAHLKARRAEKHIQELKDYLVYLGSTYTSTIRKVADGGQLVRFEIPNPLEIRQTIALIAGDALNNLKSSLDYAWIGLLEKHQIALPKRPKFPIYKDAHGVEDYLTKSNIPRESPVFDYIMNTCRPHEQGQSVFRALHQLNNHDKHRLLLPTMSYAGITELNVLDKNTGEIILGQSWGMADDGPFEFYFQPSLAVHTMGKLSVSFLVTEDMLWHPTPLDDALRDFANATKYTVNQMEYI